MASKQDDVSDGSPYAGKVMELGEIKELLAKFGMMVGLDTSPGADTDLQVAQLAHALVGVVEAHATRAEDAYRGAGAGPAELIQASLMAFAGVNCQNEVDELCPVTVMYRRGEAYDAAECRFMSKAERDNGGFITTGRPSLGAWLHRSAYAPGCR